MPFAYTPSDGLLNVSSFPTVPTPSTDGTAARTQVQTLFGQIRDAHNTLDDTVTTHLAENVTDAHGLVYAEGTWTPELKFGGANTGITYSVQEGRYTRVGRIVHWEMRIVLSNKGTATGSASLIGLPFISNSSSPFRSTAIGGYVNIAYPAGKDHLLLELPSNVSLFNIRATGNNTTITSLSETNFSNTSEIRAEGTYQTN